MIKNKLFFIDAETDGLNGSFISVAIIVTDMECKEIERLYCGISKEKLDVKDEWTIKNVLPILGQYEEVNNEEELLERVWQSWEKYSNCAYAIGDVIFPVEARLFQKCIMKNVSERGMQGPFPLLDLASLLYANKIDPLCDREKILCNQNDNLQHNALYDVETMIKIYKYLKEKKQYE